MKASTKVLIVLIAIASFGIGWIVNSAQVESEFDSSTMLNAQLMLDEQTTSADADSVTTGTVADRLESLTLVNFWASWCAPCREEMPMFEALYRQHKNEGFQIVGVTIDSPEKARPMLDSMDISYPILYAEKTGMQIMASVGNPNGLLPYSLLLDSEGQVIGQKLGTIKADELQEWIANYL